MSHARRSDGRRDETRECANPLCGRPVTNPSNAARYCSTRCAEWVAWERRGISPWVVEYLPNDPCAYCGGHDHYRSTVGIDHIVPKSKGGDDTWSNLTASCVFCNSSKHNRSLLHFLLSYGLAYRRLEVD